MRLSVYDVRAIITPGLKTVDGARIYNKKLSDNHLQICSFWR